MIGCASLQCGHCRSVNSTSSSSLPAAPRAGPSARASSTLRVSSKGFAPKAITLSAMACLPSGVEKNTVVCDLPGCDLSPTNTTIFATPGAFVERIAATCHVRFGSKPQSCVRNELTVSTVGEVAVKNLGLTGGNGFAGGVCAAGAPGADGIAAGVCAASASESIEAAALN